MVQKLKSWLANPKKNYAQGVDLYLKLRTDNKFDKFFQEVKTPDNGSIHFKMLVQRLANILRIEEAKPASKEEPVKEVDLNKAKSINVDPISLPEKFTKQFPKIDANPMVRIEELPEELQKEYLEVIQPLAKELAHFHEVAKVAQSDDERKEAINKAAELEDQKAEAWAKIDEWWKVNKLGEGQQENVPAGNSAKEAVEIAARIDDLKTNINRARKELDSIKDANKKAAKASKITEWETELTQKSERLNELTKSE